MVIMSIVALKRGCPVEINECPKGYGKCDRNTCHEQRCHKYEQRRFLEKIKTINISSKAMPTRGKK